MRDMPAHVYKCWDMPVHTHMDICRHVVVYVYVQVWHVPVNTHPQAGVHVVA